MASTSRASQAPRLLELPPSALKLIAQELNTEDKKSLALTFKAMPPIIRPLWRSIIVDLSDKEPLPPTLAEFLGVTGILIADSALAPMDRPLDWEDQEEGGYDVPPPMPLYENSALSLVSQAVSAIYCGTDSANSVYRTTQPPREMRSLQIGILSIKLARELIPLLEHATPENFRSLERYENDQELEAPENTSTTVGLPAAENPATAAADNNEHVGPEYPFINVDAGWFYADGELTDVITKGSVVWFPRLKPEYFKLELYKKIHTLRLCIRMGDNIVITSTQLSPVIAPKLNSLPLLRELHLGCPSTRCLRNSIFLNETDLQLPALTKLVLNETVQLISFASLGGLSSLRVLSITMLKFLLAEEAATPIHPEDLPALAMLYNLRSLVIDNWCIKESQDISVLKQPSLTKLHLRRVNGTAALVQPSAPMPNLKDFLLERAPNKFETFIDGDQIASWALGKAGAAIFPNVANLYLKFMGPISVTVPNIHRGQHTQTSQIQSMIAHSSSLSSIVVEQVHMNIHARSLHFSDEGKEKFSDDKIRDEIELAGAGGLKHIWERCIGWREDVVYNRMMIRYSYRRCE